MNEPIQIQSENDTWQEERRKGLLGVQTIHRSLGRNYEGRATIFFGTFCNFARVSIFRSRYQLTEFVHAN